MTGYGKCCGRRIVAKNWKYCPFDGTPLQDGEPVSLRSRIEDAEQTGMDEFLTDLASNPQVRLDTLKLSGLKDLAKQLGIKGRSKMNKADLLAALELRNTYASSSDPSSALFDF